MTAETSGCVRAYSPWCRVAWRAALWVLLFSPGIALCEFNPDIEQVREQFYRDLREPGHSHLGRGLLDRALEGYDGLREKAKDRFGLDWLVAHSYLYQRRSHGCNWANRNTRGCENWTNNSELDFLARWELVDSERFGKGSFNWMTSFIWRNATIRAGARVPQPPM